MGIITKIEEQKNKNRVNIFVDDSFFCGLEKESAAIFRLKVGGSVDEELMINAIKLSEEKRAFEKAMDYLSIRMHSKQEIYDKLLKKGFQKDSIDSSIEKLSEYHYIDDDMFTRQFIEQNSNLSKKVLFSKLLMKGIDTDIIDKNLSNIDDDSELENCFNATKKYVKSKTIESISDKQKLIASLSRKGYSFSVIKKAINMLEIDVDDFEDM